MQRESRFPHTQLATKRAINARSFHLAGLPARPDITPGGRLGRYQGQKTPTSVFFGSALHGHLKMRHNAVPMPAARHCRLLPRAWRARRAADSSSSISRWRESPIPCTACTLACSRLTAHALAFWALPQRRTVCVRFSRVSDSPDTFPG